MAANKSDTMLNWIAHGPVRIVLDATHPDVVVPKHLRGEVRLVLEFGFNLAKPIPDMTIDQVGVRGTLSFPDVGFSFCDVPWKTIFAIGSRVLDKAEVWLNDAPALVQSEFLDRAGERANARLRRSAFQILQGGKSSGSKRRRA